MEQSSNGIVMMESMYLKYFMKRFLFFLLILMSQFLVVTAQHGPRRGDKMEMIHAAKMAYIVDRLHLTESQSAAFTPVYNEFEKEIKETRRSFREKIKTPYADDADDTTVKNAIDDNLDYQERVIAIKRKYNDQFLRVISPQQLRDLPKAQREFKNILIHQMENRRMEHDGRPGPGWGRPGRGF